MGLIQRILRHIFFVNFLGGMGGPSPAWILVQTAAQTFKALKRGQLTSFRGLIAYRIYFGLRRSFLPSSVPVQSSQTEYSLNSDYFHPQQPTPTHSG